jgi:hydrogenase maturation protein HypF
MQKTEGLAIRVFGIVQGVGFRPFVSRTADALEIKGSVANKGSYVEIHAQGTGAALDEFVRRVRDEPPPRAAVLKLESHPEETERAEQFLIIESEHEAGDIFVSPDIATCKACEKELFDPHDRRYLHPFINCTACGPRLTILDSMPYDRERTSMGEFPMCPECAREYVSPETRRYDAQPVCCNDCGPELYLLDRPEKGAAAITAVRKAVMAGKIAAIKGIGGFHLCCDAKNDAAVARLRELKARPMKPFAVMLRGLDTVRRECELTPEQETIIDGHQKPILLLEKRPGGTLSRLIAPGNPTVGVMLPYAPVQMLLFSYPDGVEMTDCLVMTSGNVSGAPICRSDEDAREQIAGFCDLIMSHNRKIRLRADDSVMDFLEGKPYMIRRSRGYAPLPMMLSGDFKGHVLGIGGELKNTFCVGKNSLLYPSPYIGDMEDIRTVAALKESVVRMETLLEAEPELVACDMHPRYNTAAAARELGLPVLPVQHHYAHILSCMAENDFLDRVIGVSFDGTGYGTDGTIWGGEFLECGCADFVRRGFITPFQQVGGDASAREGWRIAAAMLRSSYGGDAAGVLQRLELCTPQEARVQAVMEQKRLNTVLSTSAGRLFDAVSAILGLRRASTFEGEASMALQFAAEAYLRTDPEAGKSAVWHGELLREGPEGFSLATDSLVSELASACLAGGDRDELAFRFHAALADMIAAGCRRMREDSGIGTAALSGGVFQNRLLTRLTAERLRADGFRVLLHSLVPPNDGGIALGQALAALYKLNNK